MKVILLIASSTHIYLTNFIYLLDLNDLRFHDDIYTVNLTFLV